MSSSLSLFRKWEERKSDKISKRKPVGNGRYFLLGGKKKKEYRAKEVVNAGLLEAVVSGETKIECKVENLKNILCWKIRNWQR